MTGGDVVNKKIAHARVATSTEKECKSGPEFMGTNSHPRHFLPPLFDRTFPVWVAAFIDHDNATRTLRHACMVVRRASQLSVFSLFVSYLLSTLHFNLPASHVHHASSCFMHKDQQIVKKREVLARGWGFRRKFVLFPVSLKLDSDSQKKVPFAAASIISTSSSSSSGTTAASSYSDNTSTAERARSSHGRMLHTCSHPRRVAAEMDARRQAESFAV